MKKRFMKSCFNMVEVALAMAVIAIGISSILVLLPVGANANKSAIANNNIADIVEYITGYLQYRITDQLYSGTAMNAGLLATISSTRTKNDLPSGTTWSAVAVNSGSDQFVNLKQDGNGNFRYEQITTLDNGDAVVDFSAELRLWTQSLKSYYRDFGGYLASGDEEGTSPGSSSWKCTTINAGDNYERLVFLEVSWPAEVPWANRDSRIYMLDFYNPNRTNSGEGVF